MTDIPADAVIPRRSLEWVRPLPDATGFEALCDCATITEIVVEIEPGVTGTKELAWICDGCLTAHWFTVTVGAPAQQDGQR